MCDSYIQGIDLHRRTAARSKVLMGIDKEMNMGGVTSAERQDAKITNFGVIYGRSDVGLSKELKISVDKAQNYIDSVFEEYPSLKKLINKVQKRAKKEGKTVSKFGRVRWLPAAKVASGSKLGEALRQSFNHVIQSTASDITLLNLIRLHIIFQELELDANIIITVHDSIIVEVADKDLDSVCIVMKEVMETPIADWINIPFQADVEFGPSWGKLMPHYEHTKCTKCGCNNMQIRHTTKEVYCEECDHEEEYDKVMSWMDKCKEAKNEGVDAPTLSEFLSAKPKKKRKNVSAIIKKKKKTKQPD